MSEDSFERIRGVGNVQLRKLLKREKIWEIAFDALVGTAKTSVSVMPSSHEFVGCFLCKEVIPFVMPKIEPMCETCFIGVW